MASADSALGGGKLLNQLTERWRQVKELTGRSHRGIRQYFAVLLISLGALLSLYVGGTYLWMYEQQRELMQEFQAQNTVANPSAPRVGGLTRISIPKINLDAVIMEGTSHKSLTLGPAHLRDSALPGDPGNSVLAAHRDTFFRHLYELKPGDDIFVERNGQHYHYVVTGKRVVQPADLSVLDTTSESRLTRITCYPVYFIGPAPERLVVFAKLAQGPDIS
jgi:LPXTG-site transpeptidase (sortase) family protein